MGIRSFLNTVLRRIPGLSSALGRLRFQTYVANPVPPHVSGISTRFDLNITCFTFEPPLDRDGILKLFEQQDMRVWPVHKLIAGDHLDSPTAAYYRWVKEPAIAAVWLYVDDEGKGLIIAMD